MRNSGTILRLQVRGKKEEETVSSQKHVTSSSVTSLRHEVLLFLLHKQDVSTQSDWFLNIHLLFILFYFFIFAHQSQCWDWISKHRKKTATAENNTQNMEPANKKSRIKWVRVGSFLSAAFTQTELDSSHLESLKPAQRSWGRLWEGEGQRGQKERAVSGIERKEEKSGPLLQAADLRSTILKF